MIKQFILLLAPFLFVGCGNADTKPDLSNTAPERNPLEEAVDWAKIQNRNGDAYLPNTDVPYSGWAKRTFENGQVEVLAEFTKGSVTRLKQWKENGIPEWNIGFIDGKVRLEDLPPKPSKVELMFTLETSVMLPRTSEDLQKLGSYGIAFKSSNLSCYDASYRNGIWIKWHKNGQINIEANYDSGIQSGIMTAWNTKGVPYMKKYYHDDGGYTKKYYENGQIKYEDNWKNGKREGLEINWHENGEKAMEANYKDGIADGLRTTWYDNGQKEHESNWKDDEIDGLATWWYENGEKAMEANYKDGMADGLETGWYENGQKEYESKYKDKMLVTATSWNPNGEKCPVTNIEEGNGIIVHYKDDGTEDFRKYFKEGVRVQD